MYVSVILHSCGSGQENIRRQSELTEAERQPKLTPVHQLDEINQAVDSRDPGTGLAAVASLRILVEELEALHVDNARARGWSWQSIAEALGVTRQSVHKKHHVRRGLRERR
jgi:hypothetical protein